MVNLYIVYEINLWSHKTGTDFTLGIYLKLLHSLKNLIHISILIVDMVLDLMHKEMVKWFFSMWNGSRIGKNVIFGVYWLKKKDILILGKSPTDGLDDATITAETKYSINFTEQD